MGDLARCRMCGCPGHAAVAQVPEPLAPKDEADSAIEAALKPLGLAFEAVSSIERLLVAALLPPNTIYRHRQVWERSRHEPWGLVDGQRDVQRTQISRVRRKLLPLGWQIAAVPAVGYRLVRTEPRQPAPVGSQRKLPVLRPSLADPVRKAQVVTDLAAGVSRRDAAAAARISLTALYKAMARDATFARQAAAALQQAEIRRQQDLDARHATEEPARYVSPPERCTNGRQAGPRPVAWSYA